MATDRDIGYTINDILGGNSLGSFSDEQLFGEDTLDPTNSLLLGGVQRTSTAVGRTATVKAGEDIRPALESLKSAGGGTLVLLAGVHKPTYDIVGGSKISIIGEGVDQTIVEFSGAAYGIKYTAAGGSDLFDSFKIASLTVQNSNASAGVQIDFCDYFQIQDIKITSCDQDGISVKRSQNFIFSNVIARSNTGSGVVLAGTSSNARVMQHITFQNCLSLLNGAEGFYINTSTSASSSIHYFTFVNCIAKNNTNNGFKFAATTSGYFLASSVIGCASDSNGVDGYDITSGAYSNIRFIGCTATNSGTSGFDSDAGVAVYMGCYADDNGNGAGADWDITSDAVMIGNIFDSSWASSVQVADGLRFIGVGNIQDNQATSDNPFDAGEGPGNTIGNINVTATNAKDVVFMKNTSGSDLDEGTVMIYKSVAAGDEVTTTTTQGDDKVCGVIVWANASSNNDYVAILREGKTTTLKVDGTTDIAVGDFLATFTSAGIAAKAGSGDMAFAIALEAYTTDDSLGVIDALLITPRKI